MSKNSEEETPRFTDPRFFADHPLLEYAFIASCVLGQILTQAGSNYTLSLLDILGDYYGTVSAETSWYMSSFALTCGTLILISGRLGDIYGLRLMILLGYAWTVVWSAIAGAAYYVRSSPEFFIVCRAFQGIGIAFILPNVLGAAGSVYTAGTLRKHIVFALVGWAAPVGGCLAPFFAGIIAVRTSLWNWICWSYLIACTLALILAWVSIPHFQGSPNTPVDWIGCGMAVTGLALFNFVWNQAPLVGWQNPYIIVLLIIGVLFLVAFVIYELHVPRNPLLPREVIQNLRLVLCLLSLWFAWGTFGVMIYHYYTFCLNLRHYTPLATAAGNTPAAIMGGVAALSTPFLMRLFTTPGVLVFSGLGFLGSALLIATLRVDETYWRSTFGNWLLAVWGMDSSFPAGSILLSDTLPAHLQGLAGSLIMVMINYGISFFVGVSANVETQVANRGGDLLEQHRDAMWFAVGIAGGATGIAIILLVIERIRKHKGSQSVNDSEGQYTQHDTDSPSNQSKQDDTSSISGLSTEPMETAAMWGNNHGG